MTKQVKIFTVGVAVVDIVMTMDEMPKRAEKYRADGAAIVGGGCGANAAAAIVRLGGECKLAARLGDDPVADMILNGLEHENVDCSLVRRFADRRSSFSSIFIDKEGERQIVNYRDPELPAAADWLNDALPDFDAALADNRWTEGALVSMQAAKARGKPGVIDAEAPILDTEDAMRAASHVVFSAQGLREYTGTEDLPLGLETAAARLGDFVGVTDGPNGVWWREEGVTDHMLGFDVEVVDTLGAGDVWHGAFALALAEKMPTRKAIKFSNAVAAQKCTRPGGREGSPTRIETDNFLKEYPKCN